MNLWIRTQDRKTLLPMGRIDVDYSSGRWNLKLYGFDVLIGYYDTKERAIEIIDEIQALFKPKIFFTNINEDGVKKLEAGVFNTYNGTFITGDSNADIKILNSVVVYEMPQE